MKIRFECEEYTSASGAGFCPGRYAMFQSMTPPASRSTTTAPSMLSIKDIMAERAISPVRFPTIDDCRDLSRELAAWLTALSEQKYPLGVRKGSVLRTARKGVKEMEETTTSKVVKAGSKTYFFDVKQTKEGKA